MPKQKKGKKGAVTSFDEPVIKDDRFAHMHHDPRFKRPSKLKNKVKVDSRFKSMFTDDRFKTAAKVDARGRKLKHTTEEDLKRFYRQDSDDDNDDNDNANDGADGTTEAVQIPQVAEDAEFEEEKAQDVEFDEDSGLDEDDEPDYARGEGLVSSSDDDSDGEFDNVDYDGPTPWNTFQDLDNVERTDDTSSRLAAVNLDWDAIRAVDLLVLANSFKPTSGVVKRVAVYPSTFGKERMKVEAEFGPGRFIRESIPNQPSSNDPAVKKQQEADRLRAYQLTRLRYYYAIIECDTVGTAKAIYEACDGLEYEKSSNVIDLRYVPDEESFDDEPRDVATDIPTTESFEATEYTTKALQHSGVELTWDGTDQDRLKVTKRKFNKDDLKQMDFEAYVASDGSDDEDDDGEDTAAKYKALVGAIKEEQAANVPEEMEITWNMGLKEKSETLLTKLEKRKAEKNMTLGEKMALKRKEKRKAKKKAAKANGQADKDALVDQDDDTWSDLAKEDAYFREAMAETGDQDKPQNAEDDFAADFDDLDRSLAGNEGASKQEASKNQLALLVDEDDDRHFDMKAIVKDESRSKKTKRKRSKKNKEPIKEDTFQVNVKDDRFSALFTSHDYSIDPTNPSFAKTKNMDKLLRERQQRLKSKRKSKAKRNADSSEDKTSSLSATVAKLKANAKRSKRT